MLKDRTIAKRGYINGYDEENIEYFSLFIKD